MVGQGVTKKALEDGHTVIALDIGPTPTSPIHAKDQEEGRYKYYQLDATDYEAYYKIVEEEGCTAIIHLAATFNKFGEDGELTSNVPSHVSPVILSRVLFTPNHITLLPSHSMYIPCVSKEIVSRRLRIKLEWYNSREHHPHILGLSNPSLSSPPLLRTTPKMESLYPYSGYCQYSVYSLPLPTPLLPAQSHAPLHFAPPCFPPHSPLSHALLRSAHSIARFAQLVRSLTLISGGLQQQFRNVMEHPRDSW
jgi:hypothetical protein